MEKPANRSGKRAAARRRALRRRAAEWQRRVRRAAALALIAAAVAEMPARPAVAQIGSLGSASGFSAAGGVGGGGAVGQGSMGAVGGLVNRAVGRLGALEENGPGWMYYGINAADRGLGYRGSYFTVGSFIPYAEDDLGGIWSADLRGHLSTYAGFFSNVGAVRKQFVGGTILGVGVYWDYDGDQSQYSPTTISDASGSYTFAGGQTYNQVGVSGEWLTDYGNLRSNGYIPVGNTASVMGPFVGNSFLTNYGINAGLAGADLEVGAWVPGLADWAGMVSVGGYAFGNARYNLANGNDVVPYFGGVYTRLDLTLRRNWDFSLQANNDSYFDWTGFARLTYRMGGSRRRNVPDQMEQPMFRNEHVVRAHQTPVQAINPATGKPFQVYHVDNSVPSQPAGPAAKSAASLPAAAAASALAATTQPAGAGTWESPFSTLQQASAKAKEEYDIVFVHVGNSVACPYDTSSIGGYQFQKNNQYLVGEGTTLELCTANAGKVPLWGTGDPGRYPVITNATGPAIVVDKDGTVVDHLQISGAQVGISDCSGMGKGPVVLCDGVPTETGGMATINDVRIYGNGPGQTGVIIKDKANNNGVFNFTNMDLRNLTANGFVVDGSEGSGSPNVNITKSSIKNTSGSAVVVNDITPSFNPVTGLQQGRVRLASSTIDGATGPGVVVTGATAIVERSQIRNVGNYGVLVAGQPVTTDSTVTSGSSTVQVANSTISANVGVQASAPNAGDVVNITVNGNTLVSAGGGNGVNLAVNQGKMFANVVSNNIVGTPTTTTGTSATTTTGSSGVANILLTTLGTGADETNLSIKAANQDNLRAINNNATVVSIPITASNVPPPPNYDPSIVVPLPPP